ncbi:MAG: hypothetical protein MRZ90_00810 [Candidatus Gastranaerophilales bacterium]|nr:hypothetical protein [Candidatus Gastranaerophilales bacterium]
MINKINFNQTYNTRSIQKKLNNPNISFKAHNVENNNNNNKNKLKHLGLILSCILAFIAGTQASIILEAFGYKIGIGNRK